jgi:hypothetical protein
MRRFELFVVPAAGQLVLWQQQAIWGLGAADAAQVVVSRYSRDGTPRGLGVLGQEVDMPRCAAYSDVCCVFGAGLCCLQQYCLHQVWLWICSGGSAVHWGAWCSLHSSRYVVRGLSQHMLWLVRCNCCLGLVDWQCMALWQKRFRRPSVVHGFSGFQLVNKGITSVDPGCRIWHAYQVRATSTAVHTAAL